MSVGTAIQGEKTMSGDNIQPEIPQEEDAETKRKRRIERNERLRAVYEEFLEARFKPIEEEMRAEGATEKEIQRKRSFYRRISEPLEPNVWHADGTPYTEEEYIRAGMAVPLNVDEQEPFRVASENE